MITRTHAQVIVAKDELESDLDMLRQKTFKEREKEARDRGDFYYCY